jgi:hypothetical protein
MADKSAKQTADKPDMDLMLSDYFSFVNNRAK